MAGTHQLWSLNLATDRCQRVSGDGSEGNANQMPESASWSQPSGISIGSFNGSKCAFVADSESSAVRAFDFRSKLALNVAGANSDEKDLFDFGDAEGAGFEAKL